MTETVRELPMSPEEIRISYLRARNRKDQIKILADLNAATAQEIEAVLLALGVELPQPQKRREYRNWTAADDEELRDMAAAGFTATEIAQVLGRTRKAVAARRLRLGLSEPPAKKEDPSVVKEGPAIALEEERVIAVDQPSAGQGGEFVPAGQTSRDGASAGVRPVVEERSLADARNDTEDDAQEDAEKDVVDLIKAAVELIRKEAAETVQASAEEAAGARIPRSARNDTEEDGVQDDGYAVAGTLEAGGPVLTAEDMLKLVFRAVAANLNCYIKDGGDPVPTLTDVLSGVGLLALRYFDEEGEL